MKDNMLMVNLKELVLIIMLMEKFMMDNGLMVKIINKNINF